MFISRSVGVSSLLWCCILMILYLPVIMLGYYMKQSRSCLKLLRWNLGEASFALGIETHRHICHGLLRILQKTYINHVFKRLNMDSCSPVMLLLLKVISFLDPSGLIMILRERQWDNSLHVYSWKLNVCSSLYSTDILVGSVLGSSQIQGWVMRELLRKSWEPQTN